jgi:D-alanyl-D-alanine carboxypeptidase/D-alanyl-D-alanine-endopeptidase (penicillin-binding protein 4)
MPARCAVLLLIVFASAPSAQPVEEDSIAPAADDAITRLSRSVSARMTKAIAAGCLANAELGVTVRDLATGSVLFTRRGGDALSPASNQKLLTSAALLALLGPEHAFLTEFRGDHEPDGSGNIGNLYLVGGGDPSLLVEDLYGVARALASAGVRRVARVIGDDSYFVGSSRVPEWPQRNHAYWYGAPSSALTVNFNVVAVHARAEGTGAARVWVDPFPTFFDVVGKVRAGRGPLGIKTDLQGEGGSEVQRVSVSGNVRPGRTARHLRAVEDPPLFCAHGMKETLRRVGIEVAGDAARGHAPEGSPILHAHPSKPLGLIVHDMNKQSSNVFAETLLKGLGAELVGAPGSREKGLAVLQAFLEQVSSRTAGCRLVDGSGLARENRLTADVLTDLLLTMASDPTTFPEFLVTLPMGGVDGTMKKRLDGTGAERAVRAKTGRLLDVVSLSGLATAEGGRRVVFSILVNDYNCATWKVQDDVDRLVLAMSKGAPRVQQPRMRLKNLDWQDPKETGHGSSDASGTGRGS